MSRNFELLQRVESERGRQGGNGRAQRADWGEEPPALQSWNLARSLRTLAHKKGDETSEISKLVQSLFFELNPVGLRAVAFANVDAAGAPHSVGARASELLASRVNGPVCVLDANLAEPSLHTHFGVENHFGWAEALQQDRPIQDFLRSHKGTNLSFVTSGTVIEGWESLCQEEMVARRMNELSDRFDFLIVLCPPPADYPEAQILGRMADGMVLVVDANSTRRDLALQLKLDLEEAGVHLLGAVLNNRSFPIPDSVYSRLDLLFRR